MDLKKPEEGSSGPKFGPPPPPHPDVTHQFFPFYRVFKDGKVERFLPDKKCPPSDDPETSVRSKDVVISSETGLSARIFVPKINDPTEKLPVLVYIHGGGFCIESAYSPVYHQHVSTLSAKAGAICVSVDYRLAPEHPIPACYDDCWEAFQWIASHANNDGPEQWLNSHADFERVYLAGDSAGANLTHSVVSRLGSSRLPGVKVIGAVLVHPYFGGVEDDKLWVFNSKNACEFDDPKLKPTPEDLQTLGCDKVLIFVGEKDHLHDAGKNYYEALKSSGWKGAVEMKVHEGKQHVFHLFNPACDHAVDLMNRFTSFISGGLTQQVSQVLKSGAGRCITCGSRADLVEYEKVLKLFFVPVYKWPGKEPMMHCNNCSVYFPPELSSLPRDHTTTLGGSLMARCRSCDQVLDAEFKYCPFCGTMQ